MPSPRRLLAAVTALGLLAAPAAAQEPPARVVSMNLCTDQLALLLAAPGQLVSVSDWAARPAASNMAEEARALRLNSGSAEEIFLMAPDLVLAGSFTNRASVDMLRRLGLRVAVVPPARSMAETVARIREVGGLLGREAAAERLVAGFEAALAGQAARAARLRREPGAYHYPNGYTSGADTLASEVMDRAGLENAAAALGVSGAARLGLERLVMLEPFLVRTAPISGARSGRAYETADHPALAELARRVGGARFAERLQVCGTPFLAEAVAALVDARTAGAAAAE